MLRIFITYRFSIMRFKTLCVNTIQVRRGSHSLGGTYGPRAKGIVHWPTRRLVILLFITGCENAAVIFVR